MTFAPMTARAIPSRSDLPFDPEDVRPTWCRVVEGTRVRNLGGVVTRLGDGLRVVGASLAGRAGFEAVRITVDLEVNALMLESLAKFGLGRRVRCRRVGATAGVGRLIGGGVRRIGYSVSHLPGPLSGAMRRLNGPRRLHAGARVPVTALSIKHEQIRPSVICRMLAAASG